MSVEEIEIVEPEVEDTPDGGAIVKIGEENNEEKLEHFSNIVDEVDQSELEVLVSDLTSKIEKDQQAREKRDELYEEGLRRTGLGDDAPGGASFTGANNVVHPLLVEACVDFASRITKEIFPSSGPVKSKILGEVDAEKIKKAARKTEFMNYQITERMAEFRSEMEQMITQVPLGGGQYLKLRWSGRTNRPTVEFLPIDDVFLPFAASSFYSAERKTHRQYITATEYNARVKDGMYREAEVLSPEDPEYSKASEANDKIEGREETDYNEDGLRTIYEIYTSFDIEGDVKPYILSIDKSTGEALSLYRNWDPEDETCEELEWIIEFPFIPWRGAYPIGLTHLIGGLSAGATGALRALLDSAHINNLPTMLKLKGGPGGQNITLEPTEIVEIEGGINTDDVRKIAMSVPFNPPSPVLFQLLGFLVDAGKGVIQTSFDKLGETSQQQPVGTTMALIEQGMSVFSSIHNRIHNSMGRVLKVLHRIDAAYLTEEIVTVQYKNLDLKLEDFEGDPDILPVSDPHIFSETQRFAQTQAIMQRADMKPDMYDNRKVEEMFVRQMKLKPEEVLKELPGEENRDPVSENVAASMKQPIYVKLGQDHAAHIQVHLSFLQSPLLGGLPITLKVMLPQMINHLRDHVLNMYLVESKKAVGMAENEGLIKKEGQKQAEVVVKVQREIEKRFGQLSQVIAQLDQIAQKQLQEQQPQDPAIQIAQMNVQLQQSLQQMKTQIDQMKIQSDQKSFEATQQLKQLEIQLNASKEKAKADLELKKLQEKALEADQKSKLDKANHQLELKKLQEKALEKMSSVQMDKYKADLEAEMKSKDIDIKHTMNIEDNNTVKELAEKRDTDSGMNPNPNPVPRP